MESPSTPQVRQRAAKKASSPVPSASPAPSEKSSARKTPRGKASVAYAAPEWHYKISMALITLLAFATRFYRISHPDSVVFDEVHFGKFASYYLQRSYFFDVHPPFGKLLYALVGWLVGYDGHFLFNNIHDNYVTNDVPYMALRALPASFSALTVPVVFLIMQESGYSLPACVLSAGLLLFDNAHICEGRLILLDAVLVFFVALSVLCYVKFYQLRHESFSRRWWKWLLFSGMSLSCVISTKYVGTFTFATIGCAVVINLWDLLDVKRRNGALTLTEFGKHFVARALCLIVVPFMFFLFWFQVHFAILTHSGPGDDFMSPEFQSTLHDNPMTMQSVGINYYDHLTFKHRDTKVFLHSHPQAYPLRYDDGRVSSQGQQVTGYAFNDTNNHWEILPTVPLDTEGEHKDQYAVKSGDIIQLRHIQTDTFLLTHDVASPYFATNEEFTTVSPELAAGKRHNDTLFELRVDGVSTGDPFRTKASLFRLIHVPTKVAMWTHSKPLPDWGFKQAEINGNKKTGETSNIWFVDDVVSLPADSPRLSSEPRRVQTLSFLRKWRELQGIMFRSNNALTSSHPYASQPLDWPFMIRGVSFWTDNETRSQIYFIGNPIGWWITTFLLTVLAGLTIADQITLRRGIDAFAEFWGPLARYRFYSSTGFFFICWAAHYYPFYLMGRQLFLHHYLPAHVGACLVTGGVVETLFSLEAEPRNDGPGQGRRQGRSRARDSQVTRKGQAMIWVVTGVLLGAVLWSYKYFMPLTYGFPLDVEAVKARKWLSFDLHFAK